jgi:2-amino-4-hydroxy-6-hydroxymethyldihydropteridine diphosphokinase
MARLQYYLLGLGSNRGFGSFARPEALLPAAMAQIAAQPGWRIIARSAIIPSTPMGPSQRRYVNSAMLIAAPLAPDAMLNAVQRLEARFGRRRYRRWGPRSLDIDIILWSGGRWRSVRPALIIPHPGFRDRDFVLLPAAQIAPAWRDPVTGCTIAQLALRQRQRNGAAKRVDRRRTSP